MVESEKSKAVMPQLKLLVSFAGRLFGVEVDRPYRLHFSKPMAESADPWSDPLNWIDVCLRNDSIVGLQPGHDCLIIYCKHSTAVLTGQWTGARPDLALTYLGVEHGQADGSDRTMDWRPRLDIFGV